MGFFFYLWKWAAVFPDPLYVRRYKLDCSPFTTPFFRSCATTRSTASENIHALQYETRSNQPQEPSIWRYFINACMYSFAYIL